MNLVSPPDMGVSRTVRVGVSADPSARVAVAAALAGIDLSATGFLLVFVPERLICGEVARALAAVAPGVPAFGCTSAGQITPEGYSDTALVVAAFPRRHFRYASMLLDPLKPVSIEATALRARNLSEGFKATHGWRRFGLVFADGLSKQEDILIAALEAGLDGVPLFGGSAGHGLSFDVTHVLHGGGCHQNAALLLIVETDLEFRGLKFDHFMPTEQQIVVTDASPEDRLVHEINGSPAASEYARLIGVAPEDLSPRVFAENPLLVRNFDSYHVRAIQQVTEGGGLAFLSAIENGLILTLGRGKEILETMNAELSVTGQYGLPPEIVLGFDCVLRRLEIEQNGCAGEASRILRDRRVIGFNTYGEQHGGLHMNHTFVGIAFFPPPGDAFA
ncbi:FIST N-terminal domain-containing protein [Oceaniglobus roseus]|uniref:FIST N-terminal domain-containing protein n=1 Tax=Oceaniglobus roseus TaxID=1737570 RepID=UPI001FEB59A0|nr:FIST N-terminal domain-containing protein [Kandeliimicrobium roseum]